MIQFNLLPDVKIQFIKVQRTKRLIIVTASIAAIASVALLLAMFSILSLQKKHLSDLNKDIKTHISKLENVQDLNKILTIQNQLAALPTLHSQKPVTSRLFTYLGQVVPAKVTLARLSIDFSAQTASIEGAADSIATINKFVDTMKFTNYTVAGSDTQTPAFKSVVLTNFGRDLKGASYKIDLSFDPVIFDISQTPTLVVPKIVTTRSETELPSQLFDAPAPAAGAGQ